MSDNTQVAQFDPKKIQEKVASNVKAMMFDMLPEEQFQAMVEKEWRAFFEEPQQQFDVTSYSSGGYLAPQKHKVACAVTPFRAMVWGAIVEELLPMLKKTMESEDWKVQMTDVWDGKESEMQVAVNENMEARFEKMAVKMAASMFREMMGLAVQNVRTETEQLLNSRGIY